MSEGRNINAPDFYDVGFLHVNRSSYNCSLRPSGAVILIRSIFGGAVLIVPKVELFYLFRSKLSVVLFVPENMVFHNVWYFSVPFSVPHSYMVFHNVNPLRC